VGANRAGEVRLTRFQATKIWDATFATRWPEIVQGHPLRSALERFVRAGHGTDEVRRWLLTGEVDPTIGMPRASRYQQVTEGTVQSAPTPDYDQTERMHRLAHATGQPMAGSV
jgi:hypothetical protein